MIINLNKMDLSLIGNVLTESRDVIYIEILNNKINFANIAFLEKTGYRISELNEHPFSNFIHSEDKENTAINLSKSISGEKDIKFNNRILNSEGKYLDIKWSLSYHKENNVVSAIAIDVSIENKLSEKLLESESRFELFFENSQIFTCTHDLEGRLMTVNSAGADVLACNKDEIRQYNVKDFLHEKFTPIFDAYLIEIRENKRYSGEMPIIDKNGKTHILLFSNLLVENKNNERFVLGNAIDITKQYFLQNDLNKSRERLEQTNNLAKVGAWEFNLMKETFFWSDIAKLIHEVPNDYIPSIHQNQHFLQGEYLNKFSTAFKEAVTNGKSFDLEVQIITALGNLKWVRIQGNAEMYNGKCIRLYGAYQDINDRKNVELEIIKSRKLFDDVLKSAVEVSIIATDTSGLITLFNSGAEELLGYTSAEVVGKLKIDFFHDKEQIQKRSVFLSKKFKKEIVGTEVLTYNTKIKGTEQLEWTYIQKDNTRILVSVVISPIFDVENEIIGYLCIAKDITDERKKLLEIVESKRNAEQANLAKSVFLANMSHEIRTPLNGIIGFTDLVLKTGLDKNQEQYISIVNQSANSLLNIINDILDFSKIEAGKLEIEIEKVSLEEIVNQSIDIVNYQALNKGLEILININNHLPQYVFTDQLRLKQILVNLLSNAIKFTPEGEVELKIYPIKSSNTEEKLIRFQVKDTGIGIEKNNHPKIFEAFTQEDSSTTKKYGGTGLGLTITNKLLTLMNSKLKMKSSFGKGSTFYFDLPLKAEQGRTNKFNNIDKVKRALIIDDNKNARLMLKRLLSYNNIETKEASNGFEAIKMLEEQPEIYDVIIVDYEMWGIDGINTIKKIKEKTNIHPDKTKIILLHGSNDLERLIYECNQLHLRFRLIKPIRKKDLYQILSQRNNVESKKQDHFKNLASTSEGNFSVLIAEDNVINMILTKTLIKLCLPNATVFEAKNGIEAVTLFKKHKPSLIIMDIQMSKMNGYTATEEIRKIENETRTPIIALTAGNIKGEREKCLESGMDDFLSKPIIFSKLSECITKWFPQIKTIVESNTQGRLNIDTLKLIIGTNEVLAKELLEDAKRELEVYKNAFVEQLDKPISKKYKSIAHKLYGMSSVFGMDMISEICREIESTELSSTEVKSKIKILLKEIELLLGLI